MYYSTCIYVENESLSKHAKSWHQYMIIFFPEGRYIKHNLIKCFQNLGALEKFANDAMDKELLGKIRIVKTYNTAIPAHISKIRERCIRDQDLAGN